MERAGLYIEMYQISDSEDLPENLYVNDGGFEDDEEARVLAQPIVVGYVFGPKKMSTMGVVMAEASKTKLCTDAGFSSQTSVKSGRREDDYRKFLPSTKSSGLTQASLVSHEQHRQSLELSSHTIALEGSCQNATSSRCDKTDHDKKQAIVFTIGENSYKEGIGLQNIVRYFQSSCSSIADGSESTGTCTASTSGSHFTANTTRPISSSASSRIGSQHYQVRVSFVPLDPELPLEEQHGGKMDIILHKLTEDILCLSQLTLEHPQLKSQIAYSSFADIIRDGNLCINTNEQAALRRVHRLCQFQKDHPECCLVDNPVSVQTLMSRADIADTLKRCLRSVQSTSGIPVTSPNYAVIDAKVQRGTTHSIAGSIRDAKVSFPVIVKPLTAAGTKGSHALAVLMDASALDRIADKVPCLCQEYLNHDAFLYKVYVMGDLVSVHKRRSLPNLPKDRVSSYSYVDFDSQRPYPRLSEFGYAKTCEVPVTHSYHGEKRRRSLETEPLGGRHMPLRPVVSKEEVQPIVDALKAAFGLELFGFDVLVTSPRQADLLERHMLVVDVNYFPSYKEVPNFPALLAQYLTNRAIQSRQRIAGQANFKNFNS